MAWTCHAVILSLVQQDSIFLPQLRSVHLVIQYRVHPGFVEAESRISEPHVVDVHVGGADPELADVFVQRISLKPHGTEERYLGKLIVENVLSIDDPDTCTYGYISLWMVTFAITLNPQIYSPANLLRTFALLKLFKL